MTRWKSCKMYQRRNCFSRTSQNGRSSASFMKNIQKHENESNVAKGAWRKAQGKARLQRKAEAYKIGTSPREWAGERKQTERTSGGVVGDLWRRADERLEKGRTEEQCSPAKSEMSHFLAGLHTSPGNTFGRGLALSGGGPPAGEQPPSGPSIREGNVLRREEGTLQGTFTVGEHSTRQNERGLEWTEQNDQRGPHASCRGGGRDTVSRRMDGGRTDRSPKSSYLPLLNKAMPIDEQKENISTTTLQTKLTKKRASHGDGKLAPRLEEGSG